MAFRSMFKSSLRRCGIPASKVLRYTPSRLTVHVTVLGLGACLFAANRTTVHADSESDDSTETQISPSETPLEAGFTADKDAWTDFVRYLGSQSSEGITRIYWLTRFDARLRIMSYGSKTMINLFDGDFLNRANIADLTTENLWFNLAALFRWYQVDNTVSQPVEQVHETHPSSDAIHSVIKTAIIYTDEFLLGHFLGRTFSSLTKKYAADAIRATTSTCLVSAFYEADVQMLHITSLGNMRAFLGRPIEDAATDGPQQYAAHVLSVDHSPQNPSEKQRIAGFHPGEEDLFEDDLFLGRSYTRAIGDGKLKWSTGTQQRLHADYLGSAPDPKVRTPPYISAEPDITAIKIKPGDFLVLSSNWLSKSLTSEEVVGLVGDWLNKNRHTHLYDPIDPSFAPEGKAVEIPAEELPVTLKEDNTTMFRRWNVPKRFITVEQNPATHVVNNALGGANLELRSALEELPLEGSEGNLCIHTPPQARQGIVHHHSSSPSPLRIVMSGWQQPGYQYPMQTGYPGANPQYQQQPAQFQQPPQGNLSFLQNPPQQQQQPGLVPQRTGYVPPAGMQQPMQPQATGYPGGGGGFLQSQPTGYVSGGNFQTQHRPAPPPPVPALPPQFAGQGSALLGAQQPSRFMSTSPGPMGLVPQATGFPGQRPLVAQPTGFVDPRLALMSNSFMPMNTGSPYSAGGAPQLQTANANLQQSFQQIQAQKPRISWALGKAEKKSYDAIFRAWDAQNTGFISGQTALEVFGQSGLSKDDLARIWTLADIDDRGKLNIAEFHVAMGIIYRRLNGNDIPDQLPPELIPPSSHGIEDSVHFMRDILKNETRSQNQSPSDGPTSYLPNRSLNSNTNSGRDAGRDATIYKHNDTREAYKPRNRHVDRDAVRSTSEMDSPSADLSDIQRQLKNTASMLDRAAEADRSRNAEDEALSQELEDLKYRAERINEDLAYTRRGIPSAAKDDERRRLERELMELMHVKVPEVERRLKQREERKEKEKREENRERDRRNERFGRYDDRDRDRDYDRDRRRYDDEERDRPYSRGGGYRDDRDFDRGQYRRPSPSLRDREYERDDRRERDYDRPRSAAPPEAAPTPPPAAARPAATPSPAPATKNMTPEERQAFARAEAKRRVEARMAALGVTPSPGSAAPAIDTSIEERLAQEKKEAEQKALLAAQEAEAREAARKERLASEKALREPTPVPTPTTSAAPPAPTPVPTPSRPAAAPPKPKAAPPPPAPRSKVAPPPPKPRAAPPPAAPPRAPAPPPAPAVPEVDPEEELYRQKEEQLRKQREARAARLRQLELEEEQAAKEEEDRIRARTLARQQASAPQPASPAAPSSDLSASVTSFSTRSPSPVLVAVPTPTPPPATIVESPPTAGKSNNPFDRIRAAGGGTPASPPVVGGTNPWESAIATPPVASPASPPAVRNNPFPAPVKTLYNTAPTGLGEDDWEDVVENEGSDSDSDDEPNRNTRRKLAEELFGGILPPAGPRSATPQTPAVSSPPAAPAPPPPPSAPAAPPPPAAPRAPPPPSAAPAAAPGDMSALLKSIQGGLSLRKTVTVDKSGPGLSGKVIGDSAPPSHISAIPQAPSPPPIQAAPSSKDNRQSVDWYAGLAADAAPPVIDVLPPMKEESEYDEPYGTVPDIHVEHEPEASGESDLMADIDKSVELRVRSLYAYQGDGPDDLSFSDNIILLANPSKSGGDWWFGKSLRDGSKGLFPKTYVQEIHAVKAKAVYAYAAGNPDEVSFDEGEQLTIIDHSEDEWWKVDKGGEILIAPAGYLELVEVPNSAITTAPANLEKDAPESDSDSEEDDDDEYGDGEESDYHSLDGSDDENGEAREHERQLVLEAAGLILKNDAVPPPPPTRRRSSKDDPEPKKRRRPPPAAPVSSRVATKELPPIPLDDAFERYEAFREQRLSSEGHRLSVASIEVPSSPTMSMTPSVSSEGTTTGRGYSHFLHFLGRKTPNSGGEDKIRPMISGPILQQVEGAETRANSPAFGSSWASLVDKSALEGIPTNERKRQEAIFELIATEITYVRDLQLIVETFYARMLPILERKAITVVFANIEDILLTNTTLMSSLEERQKECRLYVDRIGDILSGHICDSNMDMVYMEYCVNQSTAAKVLQSLRAQNPEVEKVLSGLKAELATRNLDLEHYLLTPMQRITRYPLLIKQILHFTEAGDEHRAVHQSLNAAERILRRINESIRQLEGRETLARVSQTLWIGQGRLDLTAPTRHMGARQLIKEGPLVKCKSGRRLHGYLCSDILVLVSSEKTLYRLPIPLRGVRVGDYGNDESAFQIEGIALRATGVRDCQVWMSEIERAAKKCADAERRSTL
ncbi:unnamed protein product [Mycena citricolor]|uniref:Actin cytoskeleton-regulatory complex protein PAN1 n=1 Tax=Mycena citricolor TaxID=2018698 RepID=A0AAD2HQB8_9AGAR|nr:unnamed protein product [Mycena citricolor]